MERTSLPGKPVIVGPPPDSRGVDVVVAEAVELEPLGKKERQAGQPQQRGRRG